MSVTDVYLYYGVGCILPVLFAGRSEQWHFLLARWFLIHGPPWWCSSRQRMLIWPQLHKLRRKCRQLMHRLPMLQHSKLISRLRCIKCTTILHMPDHTSNTRSSLRRNCKRKVRQWSLYISQLCLRLGVFPCTLCNLLFIVPVHYRLAIQYCRAVDI